MKIDRKKVQDGIVQITTSDERYYYIEELDRYLPSLTYILSFYPKGKSFESWLKDNGSESDNIRDEAAVRGSKIHQALESLKNGNEVKHDDLFLNTKTNNEEELTGEEYTAVCKWVEWCKEKQPKFLLNETTLYSEKYGFACTLDEVYLLGDQLYIDDIKTGKSIHETHKFQVSAVKRALLESVAKKRISIKATPEQLTNAKLTITQINASLNKKGIRITEIDEDFEGFQLAYKLWERAVRQKNPPQIELPEAIKL